MLDAARWIVALGIVIGTCFTCVYLLRQQIATSKLLNGWSWKIAGFAIIAFGSLFGWHLEVPICQSFRWYEIGSLDFADLSWVGNTSFNAPNFVQIRHATYNKMLTSLELQNLDQATGLHGLGQLSTLTFVRLHKNHPGKHRLAREARE